MKGSIESVRTLRFDEGEEAEGSNSRFGALVRQLRSLSLAFRVFVDDAVTSFRCVGSRVVGTVG